MPIFEYRCTSCRAHFETLVSRADRATPRCPRCGAAQAERLVSTFAVGRSQAQSRSPGPCGSSDCACGKK
jgi:putative FmdB family regulatory protein